MLLCISSLVFSPSISKKLFFKCGLTYEIVLFHKLKKLSILFFLSSFFSDVSSSNLINNVFFEQFKNKYKSGFIEVSE